MSSTPNFTDPQFVDAAGTGGLNAAFGTVSGAISALGSGAWAAPGLIAPEAMTVSFSGLVATVGLPQPWGLVNASGTLVHAHGTQTGADTQSYSASFASLVPATGSVTAYLVASNASIQQNSFSIPGPPPGHPSYNPNFVPTIGYATNVGSVSLTATSGIPDNINTFELFRTTLVPSQTSVSAWNMGYQRRALPRLAFPAYSVSSGGALTPAQAQGILYPATTGLTNTLPSATGAAGLVFRFFNTTGSAWTISTAGSDFIYGFAGEGQSSIGIPSPGYMELWADASGSWNVKDTSPSASLLLASRSTTVTVNKTYGVSDAGSYVTVSGSATTQTLPAANTVFGLTYGFFAATACTIAIAAAGGSFQGGSLGGSTSVALSAGDWILVQSNSTNYNVIAASPDIVSVHGQQAFTSTGTWTVPGGVVSARVRVWGAGGGGAGSTGTNAGGGAGGGGYAEMIVTGLTPGSNHTITVGVAGGAGTSGGGAGGNGGNSSFDSTVVATGGSGGEGSGGSTPYAGGGGGTGTTGTIQMAGGHGNGGGSPSMPMGGASPMGGAGGAASSGEGSPGAFPGGGGAGWGANTTGAGRAGAGGYVVIDW